MTREQQQPRAGTPVRSAVRRALLPRRPRTTWGYFVPVVTAVAGLLFTTTAITAGGTDLRAGRRTQIIDLIQQQQHELDADKARIDALHRVIAAGGASDPQVAAYDAQSRRLTAPAGLSAVHGPGLTVSLDDAPRPARGASLPGDAKPDDLVVHQQDVQSVVNAMWAGGAEAMTIQGQRVIATTAVRCVGNTLLLHGRVYAPPFVVAAIGDQAAMQRALDASPEVTIYRQYVAAYGLGYDVRRVGDLRLPAYSGPLDLSYATPGATP